MESEAHDFVDLGDSGDLGELREPSRGRRSWVIAGAVGVSLLLVWFLGRDGGVQPRPVGEGTLLREASEDRPEGSTGVRGRVETSELFAPKDPFAPLVAGAGSGSAEGVGATASVEGATVQTFSEEGTALQSGTGTVVRLVETSGGGRALVAIDGTDYDVRKGEVFAQHFQLLSVADECATLLYGDDEFTLCEGEELLK